VLAVAVVAGSDDDNNDDNNNNNNNKPRDHTCNMLSSEAMK